MAGFSVGDRIDQRYWKYDGRPHWSFSTTYLGRDEHGVWLGGAPGDVFARPGRRFLADAHYVTLIPDDHFVATFNAPSSAVHSQVYVDVTTRPSWRDAEVHAIDLDLDVVRRFTGAVLIDDEDEFVEHTAAFGYPADLVATVRGTADRLLESLLEGREPFGEVGLDWLARCPELLAGAGRAN